MCGPAIDDQEDLALRSDQKSLQKFDEHIRVHAAGFFDHKTHMTFGSYRRDQTDAVPGSCRLDDRRFTLLSPRAPKGLEEALVSDTLPLIGQDDGLDGRRHLVEWKSRPKHIANTRIAEARAAAKRELVEFLAFLIDAEDTYMSDMMV